MRSISSNSHLLCYGKEGFGIEVSEFSERWRSGVGKAAEWLQLSDTFIINKTFKIASLLCHHFSRIDTRNAILNEKELADVTEKCFRRNRALPLRRLAVT